VFHTSVSFTPMVIMTTAQIPFPIVLVTPLGLPTGIGQTGTTGENWSATTRAGGSSTTSAISRPVGTTATYGPTSTGEA
jgi:hypothetical protein